MTEFEIDPKYPISVTKHYPAERRNEILQWIFQNVPEHGWKYTIYWNGVNREAIDIRFSDGSLATMFVLKF